MHTNYTRPHWSQYQEYRGEEVKGTTSVKITTIITIITIVEEGIVADRVVEEGNVTIGLTIIL
jgi:hypothetical protein